eukprot:4824439-Alexandrium_andersonii.AAC.1
MGTQRSTTRKVRGAASARTVAANCATAAQRQAALLIGVAVSRQARRGPAATAARRQLRNQPAQQAKATRSEESATLMLPGDACHVMPA